MAIEGVTDEGLRLLARAVPADQRKRFLEYKGDEFVRSLRLALERRDRVANYVERLERHVRRAARTPALEPGPDAAAAAAGLMLVAGCGSCEPIPEGPDGCRSSDTLPAAGPDDDDDPGQPAVGPGHLASLDHLSITPGALSIATDPRALKVGPGSRGATSPGPRKKKQRIVELTVVPQPETLRTTPTYF